jgi:hypothetical protein
MLHLPEALLALTLTLIALNKGTEAARSKQTCIATGDETEINRLLDWGSFRPLLPSASSLFPFRTMDELDRKLTVMVYPSIPQSAPI